MGDSILITNDLVMFTPAFGSAIVVVQPGTLSGSGNGKIAGQAICVEGDEANVSVPGCQYISGSFSIPGTGTLKIDSLGPDQVAKQTKCGGKAVMLKGSTFTAKFEVMVPAMMPPPASTTDPMSQYTGTGNFITTNMTVKGS